MSQRERDQRIGELMTALDRLAGYEKLTGEQQKRSTALYAELHQLQRDDVMAAVDSGAATVVRGGGDDYGAGSPPAHRPGPGRRAQVFTGGDPWERGAPVGATRAELTGRALTAIERADDAPDHARQLATAALEADDDRQGRIARALIETSQPAYRSAVLGWIADPAIGFYSWSDAERAAVRRVQTTFRAMGIGSDAAGAAMVLPYSLDPIWLPVDAGQVDPMRAVSRVVQTASNERRFVTADNVSAGYYAEGAEIGESDTTLGNPQVVCHKGAAWVTTSYELAEDAGSLQTELAAAFARGRAAAEASAYTVGTGDGDEEPYGVLTSVLAVSGSNLQDVASDGPGTADMLAVQAAVPARWRGPGARFMCPLAMIGQLRQVPVATGITESVVQGGTAPTVNGWPLTENSHMTSGYLLAGDFQAGYVIVDRIGSVLETVPVLFGPNRLPTAQRGWLLHWRSGGDAIIPDAFRAVHFTG